MRIKTLLCAAGVAALALPAMAQTPVYSLNVVGYVNRVIPAGTNAVLGKVQYAFVANPLDSGNNVLSNVFASLPVNSRILRWNRTSSGFDTYIRNAFGTGWGTFGNQSIQPGEGCAIQLPPNNTTGLTNTFVGTVFQGTYTNVLAPGFVLQGYPVPITTTITNLNINAVVLGTPTGSKWYQYDEAGQTGFIITARNTFGSGWGANVPQVQIATSFMFFNPASTNRNWVNTFSVQ
jgi:hypothetical protein